MAPPKKRNPKSSRYQLDLQASEAYKDRRAKRNAARRDLERKGVVKKGDGKDINHKTPLSKGGGNSRSNLQVTSKAKNRGHGMTKRGPDRSPRKKS